MLNLTGEYECRLDPKGRIMLPVALKRQIPPESEDRYIITRGLERCLVIYPINEWRTISERLNTLNIYNSKDREFRRLYQRVVELKLDGNNRLLLPKTLLDYAGIDKDVVLLAYSNMIEVWDKSSYDTLVDIEPEQFAKLAEEVLGNKAREKQQE
jgi:MraZ protein